MQMDQATIIMKDNKPTYVEAVPTPNICLEEDIYNSLSHSIDFHPIAIHHKPNSHINILPAPPMRKAFIHRENKKQSHEIQ